MARVAVLAVSQLLCQREESLGHSVRRMVLPAGLQSLVRPPTVRLLVVVLAVVLVDVVALVVGVLVAVIAALAEQSACGVAGGTVTQLFALPANAL